MIWTVKTESLITTRILSTVSTLGQESFIKDEVQLLEIKNLILKFNLMDT